MAQPWDTLTAAIKSAINLTEAENFQTLDPAQDFWADLMAKAIYQNGGTPTGAIQAMGVAGGSVIAGWLYCDGASYLRATYQDLYDLIGNAFGTADGTHFNTPDLRGRFIRGEADGQTLDPDRAGRSAMATGGNTGDSVGSVQADDFASHTHDRFRSDSFGAQANKYSRGNSTNVVPFPSAATGGNETRPVNAYASFYIKT